MNTSTWRDRKPGTRKTRYRAYHQNLSASRGGVVSLGLTKKKAFWIGVIIVLVWIFLIGGNRGLLQYLKLRHEAAVLKEQIAQLEADKVKLQNELNDVQRNPEALERKAREQLEMTRPGEEVYYLPGKRPTP